MLAQRKQQHKRMPQFWEAGRLPEWRSHVPAIVRLKLPLPLRAAIVAAEDLLHGFHHFADRRIGFGGFY